MQYNFWKDNHTGSPTLPYTYKQTNMKVLLCHQFVSQMLIGRTFFIIFETNVPSFAILFLRINYFCEVINPRKVRTCLMLAKKHSSNTINMCTYRRSDMCVQVLVHWPGRYHVTAMTSTH